MRDNSREKQLIDLIHQDGPSSTNTVAAHIGGTMGDALALLRRLLDEGKVKQTGISNQYDLTHKYRAELDHPLALDPNKRLLCELLDIYTNHGWVGRVSLANWLGVDPHQVRELQQTLVRQRMLRLDKSGKYTLVRKRVARRYL